MPRRGILRARTVARRGAAVAATALLLGTPGVPSLQAAKGSAVCKKGKTITIEGAIGAAKINSYVELPFKVAKGVSKLTVTYSYTGGSTVLDLGIWDNDGFTYKGFRGWSGSRQGRSDDLDGDEKPDQPPVVIQADEASRNYIPAPIAPGTWHIELGVGAIDPSGTDYKVKAKCRRVAVGNPPKADPVDVDHVARLMPGWYFGDFHMHAYHSNLNGPSQEDFVDFARAAGLDFLPITEYQINRHWTEWGQTARANPDLIFWPGREVITYFGHAGIIGETPRMVEYRHGYKGISMADIQDKSVARGALFQINHPTTALPPIDYLCRGCAWELDDVIDYSKVDAIEVVNEGARRRDGMPNPFVDSAIDFWEDKLLEGYFIAPTGGSDDKLGPDYGIPATAVYAEELSRPALRDAVRAGHVWVAASGLAASPAIEFSASAGEVEAIFGDTLTSETADFTAHVTDGSGHALVIYQDGEEVNLVSITSDDFTYEFPGTAAETDNPLGSYYRIETRDVNGLLSTLGMPIFLAP